MTLSLQPAGSRRTFESSPMKENRFSLNSPDIKVISRENPECVVILFDRDLKVLMTHGAAKETLGIFPELSGTGVLWNSLPPRLRGEMIGHCRVALKGEALTAELCHEGRIYTLGMSPIRGKSGEITTGLITMQDMTAQRVLERDLVESMHFMEDALEAMDIGFFSLDRDEMITYVNKKAEIFLQRKKGDVIGMSVLDAFPEAGKLPIFDVLRKGFREKRTVRAEAYYPPLSRWFQFHVYPYLNGYSVIFDDITKQKTNALRVAKEKDLLSVTLRSIADGVIAVDREGRVIDMSRAAGELTGWEGGMAIGAPLAEVLRISIDDDRDAVWQVVAGVVESGETVFFEGDLLVTGAEEMTRRVEGSASSILDGNGGTLGAVVAFRDVTSRKRMEGDLIKAERLVSVGNLAAGIAHDFNNIMTGVLGNISLVRMSLKPGFGLVEKLNESERAIERAQKLTRQLLIFSRGGEPVKKVVRLEELVEDSLSLSLSGSNLKCDLILSDDVWPVEVDPGQIGQVVDNLVANAKEAMPDGGTIEVGVRNAEEPDGKEESPGSGRFVELSIKDNGPGIPREYIDKVFEPYFSTKGEGRGLGLATVYTIIRRHGGKVWVDSFPGSGTTVTIRLPAADRDLETSISETTEPVRGEGRILVMDDEEVVRNVTSQILASLGYEVVIAKDGEEAVDIHRESLGSGKTFAAVILDLTVPGGMGGKEAIRRMKEIDPTVKAIICSGYSSDSTMANHEENGFMGVIPKPYRVEELSRVLSSVIREI